MNITTPEIYETAGWFELELFYLRLSYLLYDVNFTGGRPFPPGQSVETVVENVGGPMKGRNNDDVFNDNSQRPRIGN